MSNSRRKNPSAAPIIDIFDLARIGKFPPHIGESDESGSVPAPLPERLPEQLEAYDLVSLTVVGVLEKNGQQWGIIRTPDSLTVKVFVGNYLGKNQGKITRITNKSLIVSERRKGQQGQWLQEEVQLRVNKGY